MKPNVYLETEFTREFDTYVEKLPAIDFYSTKENREKYESLRRIYDYLMSSNVFSDFSDKDMEKYWTQKGGFSNTLKELIIRSCVKNYSYNNKDRRLEIDYKRDNILDCMFSFFTGDSFQEALETSGKTGRIFLGKQFLDIPFFLNHSFPSINTDDTLYQIKDVIHPCSSLLIIDKFLFHDTKKYAKKTPNLINIIKWLMPENLSEKFEVSIVTENTNSSLGSIISSRFQEIYNYFGEKISLQIYAPMKLSEPDTSDRFILTNYAIFSIPHPFDRDTTIACNFYPSQNEYSSKKNDENHGNVNIRSAYSTWLTKVNVAKKIIKQTPEKIGTIKLQWKSDNILHKIFEE